MCRFRATLYQCPETSGEREQMTVAVSNRIRDLESVLHTTEEHSMTQLHEVAMEIDSWGTKVDPHSCTTHVYQGVCVCVCVGAQDEGDISCDEHVQP